MRFQIESIARNDLLSREIVRRLPTLREPSRRAAVILPTEAEPPPGTGRAATERRAPRPRTEGRPTPPEVAAETVRSAIADPRREAIVLRYGRPSLPIRNDTFDIPVADYWKSRLYPTKSKLDRAIRSVGRIEVPGLGMPFQGTGWIIAPGIVVTNRHVAELFGRRGSGTKFTFRTSPFGDPYTARIDFREEDIPSEAFEVRISDILFMAREDTNTTVYPDIAFVRVSEPDDRPLPPPIPLFDAAPKPDQVVAAIGYPAQDPFNSFDDQMRIFGGTFDVKRLAPGEVMERLDADTFTHDCTTLGGSSGSVILDVATGSAAGLHFAGAFRDANYAVSAATLKSTLASAKKGVKITTLSPATPAKAEKERTVKVADLSDRLGYQADFLGTGDKRVRLPTLNTALKAVVARRPASSGVAESKRHLLPYEHYSVVMHGERRMALFTAANIDGATINRIKRTSDPWALDPRIDKKYQIDNRLYVNNDFDRGHLVRRLDPAWGADPKKAELDTFFYTNATPQIHYFNDTLWGDLEDYLLDHSDTLNFRACIFTGPRFADNDPEYRDVLIPTAYWKVAVMVRSDTDKLTATAYLVSQSDLLTHVEFAYGQFKTYQIAVSRVEAMTGLDFGTLPKYDPFKPVEGAGFRELLGPEQIVL
jgi:endonuclease G